MSPNLLTTFFIFLCAGAMPCTLFAETILLKSGKVIEGKILEQSPAGIKIDFAGVTLFYYTEEVQAIDGKSVSSAIQQTGIQAVSSDKKFFAQNIEAALKTTKRIHVISNEALHVSEAVSSASEYIVDIDFTNKIMKISSHIRTLTLPTHILEFYKKLILQNQLAQARKKGLSEQKQKELRDAFELKFKEIVEVFKTKIEKLQNTIIDMYVFQDSLVLNVADKWAKIKDPSFLRFWSEASFSSAVQDPLVLSDSLRTITNLDIKNLLPLSLLREEAAFTVSDSNMSVEDCYVLDVDQKVVEDKMKKSFLMSVSEKTQHRQLQPELVFDAATVRFFISKKNFLPLRYEAQTQFAAVTKEFVAVRKQDMSFEITSDFSYPSESLVLPQEAQTAIVVSSPMEALNKVTGDLFKLDAPAIEALSRGDKLADEGKYDLAITEYKSALAQVPEGSIDKVFILNQLGYMYRNMEEFDQALATFQQGLDSVGKLRLTHSPVTEFIARLDKIEATLHYHVGDVYMATGKFSQALAAFDKAIALHPLVDAYQNKAVVYRLMGKYKESIEACKETLKVDPSFGKAYSSMGWAYGSLGDFKNEIECQKEAIKRWPNFMFAYYRLGEAYERLGDNAAAAKTYETALAVEPDNMSLRQALQKVNSKFGKE
ncbi:MAG: tetratricopeptide repeat protein [Candidatus Omnitrophota bacterium]